MTTVDESVLAKTPLGSDLAAGVEMLSLSQEIVFTKYIRLVLPLDGYVFWVKANLVGPSAIYNKLRLNKAAYNQPPRTTVEAATKIVKGSLHYQTDTRQEEQEDYAANRVIFTALSEVEDLNAIDPQVLWLAEFDGIRFAFSSRGRFYRQADLYHYVGMAVYADMEPQIIDDLSGFDSRSVVVSNSLPAWLALNAYTPIYGYQLGGLTLFPSFLSPQNEPPPFGTVHIIPESTQALASAPSLSRRSTHTQLCSDRVRITLWGARNFNALDFMDAVNQYSLDTDAIGIMNVPTVRDEKREQSELGTIAMKKTVEFEVSYLQTRMNDVARKLILSSVVDFRIAAAS